MTFAMTLDSEQVDASTYPIPAAATVEASLSASFGVEMKQFTSTKYIDMSKAFQLIIKGYVMETDIKTVFEPNIQQYYREYVGTGTSE